MALMKARKTGGRRAEEGELVNASFTMPSNLLASADERASELDMSRSQYFRWLARQDLKRTANNGEAA